MLKNHFDYLIIGAGVVGANIFSLIARQGKSVAIIDKALDVATGASKANSGLVHAGFDAKPNTLKAKLNVLGNKMYEKEAKRLGLPIRKTGAFVVGNDLQKLKELKNRGNVNGVENLFLLKGDDLKNKLPMLSNDNKYALFAQDAYIISPYMFTICLTEEGIINGGKIFLGFNTTKILKEDNYFVVTNGKDELYANYIINCAGAGYNDIAKLLKTEIYNVEYRRGEYFVLDTTEKDLVPATVFPLPTENSKGVLITPTIDGNILVGPTSTPSNKTTKTTSNDLNFIKTNALKLIPSINFKKTIRIFSGIRTIVGDDFIIEKSRKDNRVINVAGICSPGLSAAPAIALFVTDLLGISNKIVNKNKISPYINVSKLSKSERNKLIANNPAYGKIVCKCEGISEGEIIDALSRPLKVFSVDGVKRRTRTGMGRCQGGFCLSPTIELIAKTNKIKIEDVVKENIGSNIILGNVKE